MEAIPTDMGWVSLVTSHNRYVQCTSEGELRTSNDTRGVEETLQMVGQYDKVAFRVQGRDTYLEVLPDGTCRCVQKAPNNDCWFFLFLVDGKYVLQHCATGWYLRAFPPDANYRANGHNMQVYSASKVGDEERFGINPEPPAEAKSWLDKAAEWGVRLIKVGHDRQWRR